MIVQPVTLESGATGVSRPSIQTAESPAGACWSSTRSATSCSFLPDSCRDVEAAAWASEVRATTAHPQPLRLQRHVDRHGVAAAGRDGQERVVGRRREVPPEDRPEALDVLQEHRLPLAVGPDDRVVIGHRQLDDRVEPRERAVAREHLLDGHPRMARAEDVDQPAARGSSPAKRAAASRIAGNCVASIASIAARTAARYWARTSGRSVMAGSRRLGRSLALRRRPSRDAPAAVDDQLGAGDEPRGRLAEVERGLGDVLGRPGPPAIGCLAAR